MSAAIKNYQIKHQQILDAAEHLFLTRGYGVTTMDEIARQSKVTKQTVYRYFSSKILLLKALIDRDNPAEQRFTFQSQTLGDKDSVSLTDELMRFGQAFVEAHMSEKRLGMYRLMLCESRQYKEIADVFSQQAQPNWLPALVTFLEEQGIDNAKTLATMFTAMLLVKRNLILMGIVNTPGTKELAEHVELTVKVFCHGIVK